MDIINAIKNSSVLMSVILNNLNTGVYAIDERYRLTSLNSHFSDFMTAEFIKKSTHLCDNIVGCINATNTERILGESAFCSECELMHAITDAIESNRSTAERTLVRMYTIDDKPMRKYYRYSCKPLIIEGYKIALLMIDDITAIEMQRSALLEQNALVQKLNKKYHQELALAKKVQTSIIPKEPMLLGGYHIDFMYFPLEEIGGDMFDIIPLDDHRVGIFMCDIVGHGLAASLVTTMVKALLAAYRDILDSPKTVITRLNAQLIQMVGEPYMTAFYGVLDTQKHSFNFVRAGHPFPWKLNDGIQTFGHNSNPMIGVSARMVYDEELIMLGENSKFMLYTDGLLDAGTEDGNYEKHLIQFLDRNPDLSGKQLLQLMKHDLITNVVYDKHMDDICVMIVEHIPQQQSAQVSTEIIS